MAFFLILAFLIIHAALTDRKINGTINSLKDAVNTEQSIVSEFQKNSIMASDPVLKLKSQKIAEDHNKSIKAIDAHISLLSGLLKSNFIVISIIAAFIIMMGMILFWYLIRLTHTISGPIYVMTQHIHDIMSGK
jgi:hypothetical protein